MALAAGAVLGIAHASTLAHDDLVAGESQELAIELDSAPRGHASATGPWWSARGRVVAGAGAATVTVGGRALLQAEMGDRITGVMRVASPRRRGDSAQLWVRGELSVEPATGPTSVARGALRRVAGSTDPGWLLSGMSLGMDEGLSEVAQQDMRDAGLSHLTAVSGANCAVLLFVVHWLCGWLQVPRYPRIAVAAGILVAFVVTVGTQPSVLRAAGMAGIALVAGIVGGRRAAAHVLQMSTLLLLIADPWLAYSVGFMLSIAATGGLIALVERGVLAATFAAQVATFPILLAVGGTVGPRTVLANVLAAPVAVVIPLTGLGSAALDWCTGMGEPLAALGRGLCSLVLEIASWDQLANMSWVPGWGGVMLAGFVALFILTVGRARIVFVTVLLIGSVWLTSRVADRWPPPDWWLVACDVGQGDALVIRSEGHNVVVDTGPDPRRVDGCLDRLGVQRVDLLVLTHFHADHVDGLAGVLSGRSVGSVWVSPCADPEEQSVEATAKLSGMIVGTPAPGQVYPVGAARIRVVWPRRILAAGSVPNNASVSFLWESPQGTAAFFGDIEPEAQMAILRSAEVSADVVKVPHHGSAQFLPEFPGAVNPRLALISVGRDNTFGHPAPSAVAAWQQVGAAVYATSRAGDIAVTDSRTVVERGVRDADR